jgi:hypothetical protein
MACLGGTLSFLPFQALILILREVVNATHQYQLGPKKLWTSNIHEQVTLVKIRQWFKQ